MDNPQTPHGLCVGNQFTVRGASADSPRTDLGLSNDSPSAVRAAPVSSPPTRHVQFMDSA